jgi:hypothetical protein
MASKTDACEIELASFSKWLILNEEKPMVLPCASTCACPQDCYNSGFDLAAQQSKVTTAGCSVVYYTIGMHKKQERLTDVHRAMSHKCYVAFVKEESPIGRRTGEDANGWTIIKIGGLNLDKLSVSRRSSRIPKINPDKFFAESVQYAVYFDTGSIPELDPRVVDGLMSTHKGKVATAMLFHRMQMSNWYRTRSPMKEISAILRSNHTAQSRILEKQRDAYQLATNISDGGLQFRVMPVGSFIIHNLKSDTGKTLRCQWLTEYIHWGDRDQPPLYYILAKIMRDFAWVISNPTDKIPLDVYNRSAEFLLLLNQTSPHDRRYLPYFLEGGDRGYDFLASKNNG